MREVQISDVRLLTSNNFRLLKQIWLEAYRDKQWH